MTDITLIAKDGYLYTPHSAIRDEDLVAQFYPVADDHPTLLCHYPEGDVDQIAWPEPDVENLIAALYDAREMGLIPADAVVRLPDGILVDF